MKDYKTITQILTELNIDPHAIPGIRTIIAKKYEERYGEKPRKVKGSYVYYCKDRLIIVESIVETMENEFYKKEGWGTGRKISILCLLDNLV